MQLLFPATWGHRQLTWNIREAVSWLEFSRRGGGGLWVRAEGGGCTSLIKRNMIQKALHSFMIEKCPTREEIRQKRHRCPFFSAHSLLMLAVSLQIQTSDRQQRLSMFWSPEWIFPVHPSVRLLSVVRGGVLVGRGVCVFVSGTVRVEGWGPQIRRCTHHIVGQIS